jgi:hypothetical protein
MGNSEPEKEGVIHYVDHRLSKLDGIANVFVVAPRKPFAGSYMAETTQKNEIERVCGTAFGRHKRLRKWVPADTLSQYFFMLAGVARIDRMTMK